MIFLPKKSRKDKEKVKLFIKNHKENVSVQAEVQS